MIDAHPCRRPERYDLRPLSDAPQIFTLPTYGKLSSIVIFTVPIVLLGAVLYRWVDGGVEWEKAVSTSSSIITTIPGEVWGSGSRSDQARLHDTPDLC